MILNLKETGTIDDKKMEGIKEMIKNYTDSKDQQVCKKHKISPIFLEQWLNKNKKDAKVK